MKPLYEITGEISAILMGNEDGELSVDCEAQLTMLEGDLAAKIEGCCFAVRNREAEEAALRIEATHFLRRAQIAGNQTLRLKNYMKDCLEKLGLQKIDAGLFKVRIQANGQPTITFLGDPACLPHPWRKASYELDKDAVKKTVAEGGELPHGVAVVKGSHLRVS